MMKDPLRDIDRVISQALASEAERFAPADLAGAEQRFLRSRRRRRFTWFGGATLATAAAIVAVAVFPRPDLVKTDKPAPVAAGVSATVLVGDAPTAIAAGTDAVWVANSGDGTVTRIDPTTNEVVASIDVGGTPDEIAVGRGVVWVARSDSGSVVKIDPVSNEVSPEEWQVAFEGGPAHLDLAVEGADLWVAHEETGDVARLTEEAAEFLPGTLRATDVATTSGWPQWVYDGRSGKLTMVVESNGRAAPAMEAAVKDALTSTNGDLAVGGNGIWVSDDFGMILRVDNDTLGKTYADLGGAHSDLTFGNGYLWALTSDEDATSATLRRLDPVTADVVGDPVRLTGEPVDISVGARSVWVANYAADTVSRVDVDPGPTPEPVPSESSEELENARGSNDPVVVFSRGGDIWMSIRDGSLKQLTDTPVAEVSPVFTKNIFEPSAEAIVFERGLMPDATELVYLDLATLEEQTLMDGAWATFWPSGMGAWLERDGPSPAITFGPLFSEPIDSIPVEGASDPYSVGPIAWDQANEILFYAVSERNGSELYWADVLTEDGAPIEVSKPERLDVENLPADSQLVAPALSFSLGLDVIRLYGPSPSPDHGSFAGAELGTIETLDSGARYTGLVDLSELPLQLASRRITLAPAGDLDATVRDDGTVEWGPPPTPSWLVGDADRLFLVSASGEVQEMPFEVGAGASVSFRYLPGG